jgi:hypothetical protein
VEARIIYKKINKKPKEHPAGEKKLKPFEENISFLRKSKDSWQWD